MDFNIKENVSRLPTTSGVYVMHNKYGEIIYIGKAKNLKRRVSSYFNNSQKGEKVWAMVKNVNYFEYFLTPSDLDAFVLENSLIKKHKPYYNILLKDSKTYPYIRLNLNEKYPNFEVVRKITKGRYKYFGPYVQRCNPQKILEALSICYKVRSCKKSGVGEKKKSRPCLAYDIGNCLAPCCFDVDESEYKKFVDNFCKALSGNYDEVILILTEKMMAYAQSENFEDAKNMRDMINFLSNMNTSVADLAKDEDFDVFAIGQLDDKKAICSMLIRCGKVHGIECCGITGGIESDSETLESYISNYYTGKIVPKKILVSCLDSDSSLSLFLSSIEGKNIQVVCPQKGEKKKLIEMACENAKSFLKRTHAPSSASKNYDAILELKSSLNLKRVPKRIECYDISHISGTDKVGSMVVFENGTKSTKMYRKFKIKTVEGNNDFDCLKEVLSRRIQEFKNQNDISFSQMPDLIVIDGGKGQLSAVCQVLKGTEFESTDIISLAERFNEVFVPNQPNSIMLGRNSQAFFRLVQIRDEAHRFAITFHRNLRAKSMLKK